ncbi:acyl carrier protein [Streptomyces sp. DSM 42041]|uniref:Acyl carrier protein n=1 Tax=Streptomyces hazeniae TaxID=3075538 RepID=A0ABU2NPR0_9ACTN|nr:acyl carrier protein [Streptomyces sp. DSM 42041]MDT0378442.1 acyl carrier protein [Streptomyces sp. DSM 42041]
MPPEGTTHTTQAPAPDGRTAAAEQAVREIVAQLLDVDEDALGAQEPLDAVEGWDSVNALRLLVHLERDLGRPVDFERFSAAHTVRELAALVVDATPTGEGAA